MIHPFVAAAKTSVSNMQHTPGSQLEVLDLINEDTLDVRVVKFRLNTRM